MRDDNRLELLLFRLNGRQRFGINVLKMQEVISCPSLTRISQSHPAVRGIVHLRGITLPVIDLAQAIGGSPLGPITADPGDGLVFITEFNRRTQGFLVSSVDRIVICDWSQVVPPSLGTTDQSYISGIMRLDQDLVQILDVERVLVEVLGAGTGGGTPSQPGASEGLLDEDQKLLVIDDSLVAIKQIGKTLEFMGLPYITARDGREALALLEAMASDGKDVSRQVPMVISDVEMPEMDGYTLAREIRNRPELANLYILVHTSLNGSVNSQAARQAGADEVLFKFVSDELAAAVKCGLENRAHIA